MAKYDYTPPCRYNDDGNLVNCDDELVDYIQDSIADSKVYLRSNRAWRVADICMAVLFGDEPHIAVRGTSRLSIKKVRRQAKEMIAQQSNIRPRWGFRTPINKYKSHAVIYNNLLNHWFTNNFIDRGIRKSLQWAVGGGTGYGFLWPEKNPLTGQIDIIYRDLNYKQVLVNNIPSDGDLQKCYDLTVHLEMPKAEADEKWPNQKDILIPDRFVPGWVAREFKKVKRAFKGVIDRMRRNKASKKDVEKSFATVDIFYTWIKDGSYNSSGKPVLMGLPNSHYAYTVPSYLDENGEITQVETGVKLGDGSMEKLPISLDACKMYPNRRLVISTANGIIYDGPPQWGNFLIPVVQFKLDDVPQEFLGFPAFMDSKPLNDSADNIFRSIEDRIELKADPTMSIDKRVPDTIAKGFNPRRRVAPFHYDMNVLSNAFKPILPPEHYKVDQVELEVMKFLHEMQDYISGTNDYSWAQRLGQLPAQDTQEAIIRSMGMLATDQSRLVEYSLLQMGLIWFSQACQVYTTKKALEILGPDGITVEQFDYDPEHLVPFEDSVDGRSFHERFKEHTKYFSFYAAPNSLQERQSMTKRLSLIQIKNVGVKISNKKIYDAFVDDGEYEENLRQFREEQVDDIKLMAFLNAQMEQAKANIQSPIAQALEQNGLLNQNGAKEGRPPTNDAPARMETKSDNGIQRTTVATN